MFVKECIDTLVNNLAQNKFICIVAGYKEETMNEFFKPNKGLERRFPWRYIIEYYNANELTDIFVKLVINNGMLFEMYKYGIYNKLTDIIKTNKKLFNNNGGDINIFFTSCKIIQSNRVFCKEIFYKRSFTMEDILFKFEHYKHIKKH